MQGKTFLIAAANKINRDESVTALLADYKINNIDITTLETDGSIGIAEIRLQKKSIFLKPQKSLTKAFIIKNAETLTIEAQNALLKLLEEPPDNTLIILAANNTNTFLPTVLSRCTIINETEKTIPIQIKDEHIFDTLQKETIGQKLKRAQDLAKNKDDAIIWIENTILTLRQKFINDPSNYTLFQRAYITLKTTNTNPRLTLENLFLSL